ncbi:hypothetical protein [Actinopolymorpha pittospori]
MKRGFPKGKRTSFLGLMPLIVVIAVAASTGGCAADDGKVATGTVATSSPDTTSSPTATATPSATPTREPTPTPTAVTPTEDESTEPTSEATKKASPAGPGDYSGSGDKILTITEPGDIRFARFTHEGSEDFKVESVESQELLVDTVGPYSGRVVFDVFEGENTKRLKITADGAWTVKLLPIESVREFEKGQAISGRGDDAVGYLDGKGVAKIKHVGESNFVLRVYTEDSYDLLVNEIGNYEGEQALTGISLIQVVADGSWSIEVR